MKKIVPFFSLLTVSFLFSYGQNPLVRQWDSRFGGTANDELYSMQQIQDGGYILGGYSYSGIGGDKTQANWGATDYWIVKTDFLGNYQWDKRFGGTDDDVLLSLQQTSDGGYILGGSSYSGISGDKTQVSWGADDYWIVKADSLGNYQWDRRFGGTSLDYLYSLQQTRDGGYILGGESFSGIGGDKTQASWGSYDYWIVKIDSLGNYQWDKRFGGTSSDELYSLQQTRDGGYILGGSSSSGISGDKTQGSQGLYDYWIVKTDSLGNYQWDKRFGGISSDELYSLQQTRDGGYILGGYSLSGIGGDKTQASWGADDYWIVKTDSLGNKQWDRDFGGTDYEDQFGNLSQTADGGYLIAGTSYSPVSGNKTENNLGMEQTWIVKTDSLGNKQWDKTIFTMGHDEVGYALQTKDGCYVFANHTDASTGGYKTQASQGSLDYWIIKFCDSTTVALPHSNFISSDSSFCAEPIKCIHFYDHSTGNPTTWQWSFPGGTPSFSNLQNPDSICYFSAGTYPVTLIVTNSSGSDTLTISPMITVGNTPPPPAIIFGGLDTLISSHGSFYQWYLNGNLIAGATDSFYVAHQGGTYSVRITDSNGCHSLSGGISVGVNELKASGLEIYPNPADDELVLSNSFFVSGRIAVYNVLGEKMQEEKLITNGQTTLNIKKFSSGVYFLTVDIDGRSFVFKFLKE